MGQIIPVMHDEVIPGDYFTIGSELVIRMQPMIAPVLHEISATMHYFFVPYRLLMDDFEEFITGGLTNEYETVPPTWSPVDNAKYSLWDYFGFPVGVSALGAEPLAFPLRAYNMIYNEYYRDENLIEEVDLDDEDIKYRAWSKDYFTSALLEQQRGTAPALPLTGYGTAIWEDNISVPVSLSVQENSGSGVVYSSYRDGQPILNKPNQESLKMRMTASGSINKNALNGNLIDMSEVGTFDVNDLRLAFQVQKWQERNNRAGIRYTEFLRSHFGVFPRDDRLDRPEYIGGARSPIVISEVLQTSSTADQPTPQGTLAGHGLTAGRNFIGKYHAKEFGIIVGLLMITPKATYQQGINKQWLRRHRYDFAFPEFVNLSEEPILQAEIFATSVSAENNTVFGFQGRFDEMRYKPNMVCAGMRSQLEYWHLGRKFSSAPALDREFIECKPSKRIFAVKNEPGFIVNYANIIRAARPIPVLAQPGLIDHN